MDQDPDAAARVQTAVGPRGRVVNANAQSTGLEAESAQVVVGEAMLTMQGDKGKQEIIAEAFRLLEPGGCYAIHELGLTPDSIDAELADLLRRRVLDMRATFNEYRDNLTGIAIVARKPTTNLEEKEI